MIPFTKPTHIGSELESLSKVYAKEDFTQSIDDVNEYLQSSTGYNSSFFCNSCSDALEIAALSMGINDNDEIIVPDYTFVTTASAFALRNSKVIFCDVKDDLCLDLSIAEQLITSKTKAIVWVDYGGSANRIKEARDLCDKYNLILVQDSAQSAGNWYSNEKSDLYLGDFVTLSFHSTKNITSGGEGGALLVNDTNFKDTVEVIFEKGTNRRSFIRNEIDKYTWQRLGSSYAGSYSQASLLIPQLYDLKRITSERCTIWEHYYKSISKINNFSNCGWQMAKKDNMANGHIFWLLAPSISEKNNLLDHCFSEGIQLTSHYQSLSLSPAGKKYGLSPMSLQKSIKAADCLLRLPIWYGMDTKTVQKVSDEVSVYFTNINF